jgi:hypothetical protein
VLPEDDLAAFDPDVLGFDDLVGQPVLDHAVLMDARLVRERVLADDRLVPLHRVPGQQRHEPRRAGELARVDRCFHAEQVVPHLDRHHDLFE